jgi:hypothetical protein
MPGILVLTGSLTVLQHYVQQSNCEVGAHVDGNVGTATVFKRGSAAAAGAP